MDFRSPAEVEFRFKDGIVTFTTHAEADGKWTVDISRSKDSPARPMYLIATTDAVPTVENAFHFYSRWLVDYPARPADLTNAIIHPTIAEARKLQEEARQAREAFKRAVRNRRAVFEALR